MGFRFRKSVSLLPGIRVNFSRSGASLTAGVRGASVNFGRRGTYANLGIPGTGVSYRTRIGDPVGQAPTQGGGTLPAPRPGVSLRGWVGIAALLLFGGYYFFGQPASDQPSMLVKDAGRIIEAEPPPALTTTVLPAPTEENAAAIAVSRDRIAALQQALEQLGFNPGPADGMAGSKTIAAVKLFQLSKGRKATGVIDAVLVGDVVAEIQRSR